METLKRYKDIIFGFVAVVLIFVAYSIFTGTDDAPPLTVQEPEAGGVTAERELVALLLELRSIELDKSLFNDPAFRDLRDFSRPLEPQPVGRSNPFAPF